jgi:hypothetical protein
MLGLTRDLVLQGKILARVVDASEHEVLPYEDSVFVARLVEGILLVGASTPHTQHRHLGTLGEVDESADCCGRDRPAQK